MVHTEQTHICTHSTHTRYNDDGYMTLVCVTTHQFLPVVREGEGPGVQPSLMLHINCKRRNSNVNMMGGR